MKIVSEEEVSEIFRCEDVPKEVIIAKINRTIEKLESGETVKVPNVHHRNAHELFWGFSLFYLDFFISFHAPPSVPFFSKNLTLVSGRGVALSNTEERVMLVE